MTTKYLALSTLAATLLVSGCGGGGGNSGGSAGMIGTTPPATGPGLIVAGAAEGVYQSTGSNGLTALSLVLENDELFSVYGPNAGGVFGISGFLHGQGASNNGAYTASALHDYTATTSTAGVTFKGTYVAGASLNGTVTSGATPSTWTGAALTSTTYLYATPARLADVTGAWTMTDLTGARVQLTIGSDGKFTGTSGGCLITGNLAPRVSGKNVFTFSLLSGAAPCASPNQAMTGIAVTFTIGATRQLIAAGNDASLAIGAAYVGAR